MSTKPLKYPYDPSGVSANNLVSDEIHVIQPGRRAFVPHYGAFYVETIVVRKIDGTLLEPVTDYLVIQPVQEVSEKTGKQVSLAVYVKNPDVTGQITFTYQAVGGEFSWSAVALQDMLDAITIPEFEVQWNDIVGKPTEWNPGPHMHDLGDTYGWEFLGWQAEKIARALLYGNQAVTEETRQRIRLLAERLNTTDNALLQYTQRRDNPNEVTAAQVGLGNVPNFPPAGEPDAITGLSDQHFMTPLRTAQYVFESVQRDFLAHVIERNPHGTNAEDVGLGLLSNRPQGDAAIAAVAGNPEMVVTDDRYASIANLSTMLRTYHMQVFEEHANARNPHGTLKGDVGLPLVENFPMASDQEHLDGSRSDRYVNPRGMSLYFNQLVGQIGGIGDISAQHIANTNNPHGVTAAQVNTYTRTEIDQRIANAGGANPNVSNATGILPVARGGTSTNSVAGIRSLLGLGTASYVNIHVSTGDPNYSLGEYGDLFLKVRMN